MNEKLPEEIYFELNRKLWNERTENHLNSKFYANDSFLEGRNSLNEIELKILGDISGQDVLHLQCHFGQDTISLARMASRATGVDLSDESISAARKLAEKTGANAEFICCNVYDTPQHIDRQYDLVFTSYGTIGWLPDLNRWATVLAKVLKPGGRFIIADFHPVVWMLDSDFKEVAYRYFNSDPIIETETGSYADAGSDLQMKSAGWNHAFSEILQALLKVGFRITDVQEYDYSPYNIFKNMVEFEPGKFRSVKHGDKLPMVYSIEAVLMP